MENNNSEEQRRSACLDVSKLDNIMKGAQAKATKYYATQYAVNVFQSNFYIYYNKVLKITFWFLKKDVQ